MAWTTVGLVYPDPDSAADMAQRPVLGAWLKYAFGLFVMVVMLNLLIAMMSSTCEWRRAS